MIFIIRMLLECAIQMQKDKYLCFIDCTFDTVQHKELPEILEKLELHEKDI